MPDAALLFLGLLVPVVALLFLNLRFSRRVAYPHHLLEAAARKGPAAFLFRSFRTFYDVLLDALVALILAFALEASWPAPSQIAGETAPPFWARPAVVIDCSASMLLGLPGSRPLDRALARLAEDPALARATAFALAFDPASGGTRLFPLARILDGSTGGAAAARLEAALSFLGVDYPVLGGLRNRGFGKITLLTDSLGFAHRGFEAVESGFQGGNGAFVAYPTLAAWDRVSGSWLAVFTATMPPGSLGLSRWNEGTGRFDRLAASAYRIEPRATGWALRLASPGLYLATSSGPSGESPLRFGFRLLEPREAGAAEGPFSTLMMGIFPLLSAAPRPSILFVDRPGGGAGAPGEKDLDREARASIAAAPKARRIETRVLQVEVPSFIDPALTGGRPIVGRVEELPGVEGHAFTLGPASMANADLPLAYDGAIQAGLPPAFITTVPPGGGTLVVKEGLVLARDAHGLLPLDPPSAEFFPPATRGSLVLPPPRLPAILWAILLALAAGAKLAAYRRLSGKAIFRT
jgi:hypothetical protein